MLHLCLVSFNVAFIVFPFKFPFKNVLAYWGRDPTAAAAAAANPLFNAQFNAAAAAGLGLLPNPTASAAANDRYSMAAAAAAAAAGHHHQNTMAVAASQAASLAGLHPASELMSTVCV